QGSADIRQGEGEGAGAAGVDVLDENSAGRCAVALPQLAAGRTVVGREEQHPVDIREAGGGGAIGDVPPTERVIVLEMAPRKDVLDECGAGARAVTFPQLRTVEVRAREEQGPVDKGQLRSGGTDEGGAGGRAVAPPQLSTVSEEQRPIHVR